VCGVLQLARHVIRPLAGVTVVVRSLFPTHGRKPGRIDCPAGQQDPLALD
jgi:hypothetical protein